MKGEFIARKVLSAWGAEWCDIDIECGKVVKRGLSFLGGDGGEVFTLGEARSLKPIICVSSGSSHRRRMSDLKFDHWIGEVDAPIASWQLDLFDA